MSRITNGMLLVGTFESTENSGEYSFQDALFVNQADVEGLGSTALTQGCILYVPASDAKVPNMIPGVVHRYKLTEITGRSDNDHISAVMVWAEDGPEIDQPTSGSYCIISQRSTKHGFGFPVSDQIYPDLGAGVAQAAMNLETKVITDLLASETQKVFKIFTTEDWVTENSGVSKSLTLSNELGTSSLEVNIFSSLGGGFFTPTFVDWVASETTIKLLIADIPSAIFSGKVEIKPI